MNSKNQICDFLDNLSNDELLSVSPKLIGILKDRKIIDTNNLTGENRRIFGNKILLLEEDQNFPARFSKCEILPS